MSKKEVCRRLRALYIRVSTEAQAEEGSKYEYFLKAVYESVYKRIKLKMEAGYEMISTLKRTLQARMASMEVSKKSNGIKTARSAYED